MGKPDLDLIVVAGAPGSGKSTLCAELRKRWGIVPYIEFSDLRNFHLNPEWSNQSERDLTLAWDNLVFAVQNYARHRWVPVLVTDLREVWVARVNDAFNNLKYVIVTLVCGGDLIGQRLATRSEGFMNQSAASEWNFSCQSRALLPRECRVESSGTIEETADAVERVLATF